MLGETIGALDEGTQVARDPQTLGEWIECWLETMEPKVRASTLRDYRNGLRRVSDRLGSVQPHLPKTAGSRRSLSLDPETGCRAARAPGAPGRGATRRRSGVVRRGPRLLQRAGRPAPARSVHPRLRPRRRPGRRAVIRQHDMRHTWATLALQAGVHPTVVSEHLGHATTGITLDIDSHVQPELDAQAVTTVAQQFSADA